MLWGLTGDTRTHQTQVPGSGERARAGACGLQSGYLVFKMLFGGRGCIVCSLFC